MFLQLEDAPHQAFQEEVHFLLALAPTLASKRTVFSLEWLETPFHSDFTRLVTMVQGVVANVQDFVPSNVLQFVTKGRQMLHQQQIV